MANIWDIPDDVLADIRGAFDDVLANWGKPCQLVYQGRQAPCPDCNPPLAGGPASAWHTGGHRPAHAGPCPFCSGTGTRYEEEVESVTLLLAMTPQEFFRPVPGLDVRSPQGLIQAKCSLADWPKVKRARKIAVQTSVSGTLRAYYELDGDASDFHNVVPGRYVIFNLRRAG